VATRFDRSRTLIFESLQATADWHQREFATLLPAFNAQERQQAQAVVSDLLDQGAVEFCCVGPEAEELHDSIDWIVEDKEAFSVVTTWHTDEVEACEYFVKTAGGKPDVLLAFVAEHPVLVAELKRLVAEGP